jgi:Flp pilus assembly protein TadB
MNPLIAAFGLALATAAMIALVVLVVAPAGSRVPLARRRPPGRLPDSSLSKVTTSIVGLIERVLRRRGSATFTTGLELAGVRMAPAAYVLMVVCVAAVLAAIGALLGGLTLWSVLLAVLFAAVAPIGSKVLLVFRTGRRRAAFGDQLDDSLSLLAGSLRAGHSLLRAVDSVSQDVESPSKEEFARVVNETRIGRDLGDALNLTAARMRSEDFRWIAEAVAINQEAGGNLSDVLDQAGRTIRERNEIRRQVKALSAEGRMSALVLLALPVGVFLLVSLFRPGYFAPLFTSVLGIAAVVAAVILMIVGSLWMRVAVRVRF